MRRSGSATTAVMLALMLPGALSACQPSYRIDRDFGFDSGAGRDHAVVLIGIRSVAAVRAPTKVLGLTWQAYDPRTDMLVPNADRFRVAAPRCAHDTCDALSTTKYYALHVPAGDYALVSIWALTETLFPRRRHLQITALAGHDAAAGASAITSEPVPTMGGVGSGLRYYFGKGEIVYLGDFVVDAAPPPIPMRIVTIERVDQIVARLRDALPNVRSAPVVFRKPSDKIGQSIQVGDLKGAITGDPADPPIQIQGGTDDAGTIPDLPIEP